MSPGEAEGVRRAVARDKALKRLVRLIREVDDVALDLVTAGLRSPAVEHAKLQLEHAIKQLREEA